MKGRKEARVAHRRKGARENTEKRDERKDREKREQIGDSRRRGRSRETEGEKFTWRQWRKGGGPSEREGR